MHQHQIGAITNTGVLDIGLKCPHSCQFCYYSFYDKSCDQFAGIRSAPFRSLSECKEALKYLASEGLTHVDITGGEPVFHPNIVEIVKYAELQCNLRVRIITLGQLLSSIDRNTGLSKLDLLIKHSRITDFLFSLHAIEDKLFHNITKGSFTKLEKVLAYLDSIDFDYCTNTVVYAQNAEHIPQVANYIVGNQRRVRIANFIVMNAYLSWSNGRALRIKSRLSEIAKPLMEAIKILENNGIGVNVRYLPYCIIKGFEKNIVSDVGILFDPYEWRNGLRDPFEMVSDDCVYAKEIRKKQRKLNNKVIRGVCKSCSLNEICDGIDKDYLNEYGEKELHPYGGKKINDIVAFRKNNPRVFYMKYKDDSICNVKVARDVQPNNKIHNCVVFAKKISFAISRLCFFIYYLSEFKQETNDDEKVMWHEERGKNRFYKKILKLLPGAVITFHVTTSQRCFFSAIAEINRSSCGMPKKLFGRTKALDNHIRIVIKDKQKTYTDSIIRIKDSKPIKIRIKLPRDKMDLSINLSYNNSANKDIDAISIKELHILKVLLSRHTVLTLIKYIINHSLAEIVFQVKKKREKTL